MNSEKPVIATGFLVMENLAAECLLYKRMCTLCIRLKLVE